MRVVCAACGILVWMCLAAASNAQSGFDAEKYAAFLKANVNLSGETLISRHAPHFPYYKDPSGGFIGGTAYLDSVALKYGLTGSELTLLEKNRFMVTERLSFGCFGAAFHHIYGNDMPVFVSTDAVLQALHASYDRILQDLELEVLEPNLASALDALSSSFPKLAERYRTNPRMSEALADVDLYVTVAGSLLANRKLTPQYASPAVFDAVWDAIQSEKFASIPLFSERPRKIDFSQFIVRGHYTDQPGRKPLAPYFRCMMWLGRIDFLLTPPPAADEAPWGREEIRRMNLGAVLLNELVDLSGARPLLDGNDGIITFMVGESDNLTPGELAEVLVSLSISRADALLDDAVYDSFQAALLASAGSGQRILSDLFIMDPFSEKPDVLPVSFRLMGQRFIIDSFIFSNLVYDRIVYEGKKIWRPMPDPLDALFVLGNDDALPLLSKELATYKYSSQLSALRYLTDAYDDEFWSASLYTAWLEAIRKLNPPSSRSGFPFFMQTAAWQQEKMNTQLASWAQLRHDTLLYAKQSYTGGTMCSFPHSYVEPYPEFYRQIGRFADRAGAYFGKFPRQGRVGAIQTYFPRLKEIMTRLEAISRKELARQPLAADETEFLKNMLFAVGGSGAPPFSGWYADLFYDPSDAAKTDYVIADVHTQPTDEFGSVVGRVLHVGVGMVNLGVFLADCPSAGYVPMVFVGPVMSYYETITRDFDRLTDERWKDQVAKNTVPDRPDWVNIYLVNAGGEEREPGRELPGVLPTNVSEEGVSAPAAVSLLSVSPNPFNPVTTIRYVVPSEGRALITVYDVLGRVVETLVDARRNPGEYSVRWDAGSAASGVYLCRFQTGNHDQTVKMMLVR